VKALVVELSSLGDVVHTLPLLAVLHRRGYEVGWLAEPPATLLLQRVPMLSRLIPASVGGRIRAQHWWGAARALRREGYEAALDVQGCWKSAVWARISKAPRLIGHAAPWRSQPLSSTFIREPVDVPEEAHHDIDRHLALLRLLGIEAGGLREFPLPTTEEERPAVDDFLGKAGVEDFVLLNPGGEFPSRLWSPNGYAEVARELKAQGIRTLVSYGAGEERLAQRVVAGSEGSAVPCPPLSLLAFMELARRARLVVAADGGPLHLACAMRVPVVAIYGPTDPVRNGPFDSLDLVVRRTPLCSPCYRKRCPIHDGVMEAIAPLEVLRAVERRLVTAPSPRSLAL
jgi:ADP-heptose:LPS heptosyltransferase